MATKKNERSERRRIHGGVNEKKRNARAMFRDVIRILFAALFLIKIAERSRVGSKKRTGTDRRLSRYEV